MGVLSCSVSIQGKGLVQQKFIYYGTKCICKNFSHESKISNLCCRLDREDLEMGRGAGRGVLAVTYILL